MIELEEYRRRLREYLNARMHSVCERERARKRERERERERCV